MTENIKIDFLRNIKLFSSLSDEELIIISSKVFIEEFRKNEVILQEEDTNEFMYIILFGNVKVTQTTKEGKEIILSMHKSDDFFGEISLIDGKTSPATVTATDTACAARHGCRRGRRREFPAFRRRLIRDRTGPERRRRHVHVTRSHRDARHRAARRTAWISKQK